MGFISAFCHRQRWQNKLLKSLFLGKEFKQFLTLFNEKLKKKNLRSSCQYEQWVGLNGKLHCPFTAGNII